MRHCSGSKLKQGTSYGGGGQLTLRAAVPLLTDRVSHSRMLE